VIGLLLVNKAFRRHDRMSSRCRLLPRNQTLSGHYRTSACANSEHRAYSMTSSAVASSDCGMVRPSAFAVLRFTTISNLVGVYYGTMGVEPGDAYPLAFKIRDVISDDIKAVHDLESWTDEEVDGSHQLDKSKVDASRRSANDWLAKATVT
jgi:hypothetical protein